MKATFIKGLAAFCLLSSVPTLALAAEPSQKIVPSNNLSVSVKAPSTVTGPMLNGGSSSTKSGTVVPNVTQSYNGGSATATAKAIGGHYMDLDWTLNSSLGPITYVNMLTEFDDWTDVSQSYGCFGTTQKNVAQNYFVETGYHTATFSGWGYQDGGVLEFTVPPLTSGATVY
jgi:hypothetical protein